MRNAAGVGVWLAIAMLATGCKEGDVCGLSGGDARCEDLLLVECKHQIGNPATLQRTTCEGACVTQGSLAACVADKSPCDPKTFAESCVDTPAGKRVRICQETFSSPSASYPQDFEPGCVLDDLRTCGADGKLAVTRCANQNRCLDLGTKAAPALICAQDSTPCDPKTFQTGCLVDGNVVACREIKGATGTYPFALPPDSPEAKAAGCK